MRRKGFKLIELLVVIGIIVILVAILFPVFAKARKPHREAVQASFPLVAGELSHSEPLLDDKVIVEYRYARTITTPDEYDDPSTPRIEDEVPLEAHIISQLPIVETKPRLRVYDRDGDDVIKLKYKAPSMVEHPYYVEGRLYHKYILVSVAKPTYTDLTKVDAEEEDTSTRTDPDDKP